jgi:hypothetical protein
MGLLFLLLFFLCSCEAERFNPLDPKSPNFRDEATIYGSVLDWMGSPLEGARVEIVPGPYYSVSSLTGQYEVLDVPTGSYTLTASKDGFSADTGQAEATAASPARLDFRLDHLPACTELRATTHNDSNGSGNDFYAVFFARIYDSDGWIWGDSVYLTVDTTLIWSMKHLGGDSCDSFSVLVTDDSLPGRTLEYLVGRSLRVHATDNAGKSSVSDAFGISRIVYESPVAISPSGTAPQNPVTFKWFTVKGEFDFTYTLTVEETYPNENTWIVENIPSTTNEYFLGVLLEPGIYRWSIKAVDSFGNTSRSQVVAFMVS